MIQNNIQLKPIIFNKRKATGAGLSACRKANSYSEELPNTTSSIMPKHVSHFLLSVLASLKKSIHKNNQ